MCLAPAFSGITAHHAEPTQCTPATSTQDGVSNPADWPSELLKPAPWGEVSSDKFAFAAPLTELKKWLPTHPEKIAQFYDVVQARRWCGQLTYKLLASPWRRLDELERRRAAAPTMCCW